ncbi:MAG: RibD family protein [Candidatus Heimdallarchaeota archaeon]|nr:RibD family protein [Candidatus Heimdallarchaeota archaeon]MCK5050074.1 RibD family protein [Candidatus Heimdallarchaeota archaeon]
MNNELTSDIRVICSAAITLDGKLAFEGEALPLSSDADWKQVHALRAGCQSILVGRGTVETDDPGLLVKEKHFSSEKHPTRIIIDSKISTSPEAKCLKNQDKAKTIIFTLEDSNNQETQEKKKALEERIEVIEVPSEEGKVDLAKVVNILEERELTPVMVEGGGTIFDSLLKKGIIDQFRLFISSRFAGNKGTVPLINNQENTAEELFNIDSFEVKMSYVLPGGVVVWLEKRQKK